MVREGKESELQDRLIGVCSDLLIEARYPLAVSGKSVERVIVKLERIKKLVLG